MKNAAAYTLSAALVGLAATVGYFTYELTQLRRSLPQVLERAEAVVAKVDPVVEEVAAIRHVIPDVVAQVAATTREIPPIVEEVAHLRRTVPAILEEVRATRTTLPTLVNKVALETARTRDALPKLSATLDKAADAVAHATAEVRAYRPLVPEVLAEVEALRASIPPTLERMQALMTQARAAGQKASEGAVVGVVTGVVKAPFQLLSGLGGSLFGNGKPGDPATTAEDLALAKQALLELMMLPEGSERSWTNPDTRMGGTFTLMRQHQTGGRACRNVRSRTRMGLKVIAEEAFDICRNERGEWQIR